MERYKVEFSSNEIGFNLDENYDYDVDVANLGAVSAF